ncbi:MAG: hypothetical protein KAJ44_04445 [Thermoplasmatales archaeon]|nr:hypothetical protein [Thermoplasmatales archaeon]
MTQINQPSEIEWMNFLNTIISQRLNYLNSLRDSALQKKARLLSAIGILIALAAVTNALNNETSVLSITFIIILLITILCVLFLPNKESNDYETYKEKVINTLTQYDNVKTAIIKNECKTYDEFKNRWKTAENNIDRAFRK